MAAEPMAVERMAAERMAAEPMAAEQMAMNPKESLAQIAESFAQMEASRQKILEEAIFPSENQIVILRETEVEEDWPQGMSLPLHCLHLCLCLSISVSASPPLFLPLHLTSVL